MSYWRDIARPIISEVIERVGRDDEKALAKALRDAYPFGERRMHPYKIWCDEVRRQTGSTSAKSRKEQDDAATLFYKGT